MGVLVATKLLNTGLASHFLRLEMRQRQFKQYARENYAVLGLVVTLALLRLKVPPPCLFVGLRTTVYRPPPIGYLRHPLSVCLMSLCFCCVHHACVSLLVVSKFVL